MSTNTRKKMFVLKYTEKFVRASFSNILLMSNVINSISYNAKI